MADGREECSYCTTNILGPSPNSPAGEHCVKMFSKKYILLFSASSPVQTVKNMVKVSLAKKKNANTRRFQVCTIILVLLIVLLNKCKLGV